MAVGVAQPEPRRHRVAAAVVVVVVAARHRPVAPEVGAEAAPRRRPEAVAVRRAEAAVPGTRRGSGFGAMDSCTRDVQMQAESAWRSAQMTSLSSLMALRDVITQLGRVSGDKTVILISGGWPLDEREETSVLSPLAADAAAARVTLFTLYVPPTTFSADRRVISNSPSRDHFMQYGPLDMLAHMTGGGSFRAEVNAEAAFERLGRELSGYYRIGVEKDPADQDGKGRRMKVQVSRGSTTVRAREIFDVRTYEDRDWAARLAGALDGPVPATGVRMRVTSYLAQDPDDRSRIKVLLTGEATRIEPGQATLQVVVRDIDGKKILAGEQPVSEATADGLKFSTNIPLPQGDYVVRIGLMDSTGRVGSVEHRVRSAARPRLGSLDRDRTAARSCADRGEQRSAPRARRRASG